MAYNVVEVISVARPKKNAEPIMGAGKEPDSKLTVQKSIPLFSLWRSNISLAEFKILDTYLSRINSHEPEKRTVVFTKGELEGLLGVKKINKVDLLARLNGLYRGVEIEDSNKKIRTIGLFEETCGGLDEETGLWTVELTCTAKAMKYIFNIEKLGYLRYKLRCITNLASRYSYILFTYLEHNRFRKSWEVNVDELRQILSCDKDESYSAFKVFNDRILKRCQKELLEKTECRFFYEPIKQGRKVTSVRFTLETLADSMNPFPGQMSLDDYGCFDDYVEPEDPLQIYIDVLPSSLAREQVDALRALAIPKIQYDPYGAWPLEALIADYLRRKVLMMNAHNRNVKHPFSYLKSMIENDEDVY